MLRINTKKHIPKVFIRTFGCQANEADSELVYSLLLNQGYKKAKTYETADVILFNTCSVRKHAEDRVWGNVAELKQLKAQSPKLKEDNKAKFSAISRQLSAKPVVLGVIGCMAKAHGENIFKRLPHVNFVCGPSDIYQIVDLIEQAQASPGKHFMAIGKQKRPKKQPKPQVSGPESRVLKFESLYREEKTRGLVNITHGCNNFCSYCIVPYVRGREISRPVKDIINEIKALADDGAKEIMLLGQNVNSYSQPSAISPQPSAFIKLLEEVNKIKGIERIRFMTSHPKDANRKLFKAMRDLEKVCEHLHLPLQSGSDRILKLMNRKYCLNDYLKLVEDYRKTVKNGSLTTDIIVGFPTESDEDFYMTYMAMKKIAFDNAFIFKYSPRPLTKASKMQDNVTMPVKKQRNSSLLKLQSEITKKQAKRFLNTVQQVLGTHQAKRPPVADFAFSDKFYLKGRIRQNLQVVFEGNSMLIGKVINVKIINIESNTLIGEIV